MALCSSFNSTHVRERDKGLLRSVMVGGVWNGLLLGRVRSQAVPCRFCGAPDDDGHLFGDCPFLLSLRFVKIMNFMTSCDWIRRIGLGAYSGMVGFQCFLVSTVPPLGLLMLLSAGWYSSGLIADWNPSDDFDPDLAASLLPDRPDVWTDGSLVLDRNTGVSSSGSGFFAHHADHFWGSRRWGHADGVRVTPDVASCIGFCSVPGPLQSVQRAETWGVILALQTSRAVHLGVDNLGVVRHVGRLLSDCRDSKPFELVNDGCLLLLIDRMIQQRGLDTVCISKFKGHADEDMVLHGRVRREDKLGNDAADEAADFGRRRVSPAVIDARRNLSGVCGRWYPVILDLHRFFIAVSRAVVNHDGGPGTAPDPIVWSAGALHKRRRLVHAVRDRAFLPGPPGLWDSDWVNIPASAISAADIALWPYTPGLLVKCCLVVLVVSCLALLVLIIVDFVILVGKSVVMVSLLDLVRVLRSFSWMSF